MGVNVTRILETIKVKNSSGSVINPATEAKQDSFISQQTDGTQRTGVLGADVSSVASASNPFPARLSGEQPDGDLVGEKADGRAFVDTTPLAGDGFFESSIIDSDGWRSLEIFVATNQLSAPGGVEVEYIEDVQGAALVRGTVNRSFTQEDVDRDGGFLVIHLPIALDGFRVRYTNGSTDQGSFFIAATLRAHAVQTPMGPVDAEVTGTEVLAMVRSVLTAKDSTSDDFNNVLSSTLGDSIAEPSTGLDTNAFTMGFDDDTETWNRIRSRNPVDNMTNPGKSLSVIGHNTLWNPDGSPANRWNRMIGKPLADGQAEQLAALTGARAQWWNGSSWSRARGDTTNGLDVDVTRSVLPSGAATAANQTPRSNAFATLINAQPRTTADEIRMDDVAGGDLFIGRNVENTATSTTTWEVVKISRTATGLTTRIQYQDAIAWDDRATAGNWS